VTILPHCPVSVDEALPKPGQMVCLAQQMRQAKSDIEDRVTPVYTLVVKLDQLPVMDQDISGTAVPVNQSQTS
jgi:hypothetical protein